MLCVIDGGKGLRKALGDVLGDAAVIQRCQLHKGRNLDALVPKARQAYVRAAMRRAYRAASAGAARRQLTVLAAWLERNGHADAAGSVREGLEGNERWRDGDMRRRWIGLGLLRAAERFRRIKRHGELSALVTALGAVAAAERAA